MRQSRDPGGWIAGLCLQFFVISILLYIGVQLIVSILPWLLVIGFVVLCGMAIAYTLRWRNERW